MSTSTEVFVGVRLNRHDDEPQIVGVWSDREEATQEISSKYSYNEDFSDPEHGFWGTEDWSIWLEGHPVKAKGA